MLDAPIRRVLASPLNAAAGTLQRTGVGPNFVTATGFVFGVIAIGAIASEAYIIGLVFILLNRISDGVDGALARRKGGTRLGGFLDATLSLMIPLGIAFAFAIARQQNGLAAAFLMLGLALMLVINLAARAFAPQSAAAERDKPLIICEQSETYIIFVMMALVPWAFALFAYAYGGLCLLSAAMRFATVASSLSNTAKS